MREALMEDERAKRKEAKESLKAIDLAQDVEEVDEVDPFHEDPPTYVGHLTMDEKIRVRSVASARRGGSRVGPASMQNGQQLFGQSNGFPAQNGQMNGQMNGQSNGFDRSYQSMYSQGPGGSYMDQRRLGNPLFQPRKEESGVWGWVAGIA